MSNNSINFPKHQPVLVSVSEAFAREYSEYLPGRLNPPDAVNTTDVRWGALLRKNDVAMDAVKIVIDRWHMSEELRDKYEAAFMDQPGFGVPPRGAMYLTNTDSPQEFVYNLNVVLAVIAHYGFVDDYDPAYAKMIEPFIGDLLLRAWRDESMGDRKDRIIAGQRMNRAEFINAFDKWLEKYGM